MNTNDLQLPLALANVASESRFLCLKIMTDILIPLLNEEAIYNKNQNTDGQSQRIENLLVQNIIPLAAQLLTEGDPAPFYGQRLLSALLDCNPRLIKHIPQAIMLMICDFYQMDDSNLNKHTLKILKYLLSVFNCTTIYQRQIIPRTLELIHTM